MPMPFPGPETPRHAPITRGEPLPPQPGLRAPPRASNPRPIKPPHPATCHARTTQAGARSRGGWWPNPAPITPR